MLAGGEMPRARRRHRLRRHWIGSVAAGHLLHFESSQRIRSRDLVVRRRTPSGLLYTSEFDSWREKDVDLEVTVDIGDANWTGHIGVVPLLFYQHRLQADRTTVLTCGPEIMMRFVVFEALARKIRPENMFVSMERNMSCAMGFCGHCQIGPYFVCKDGPVFDYRQAEPFFNLEDF